MTTKTYLVCSELLFRRPECLVGVLEPDLGLVCQLRHFEEPPIRRVALRAVFDQLVL